MTLQAWQLLKVVKSISASDGRATLSMLTDLARGAGGGSFGVTSGRGKQKSKDKVDLDLDQICGGKVELSKDVSLVLKSIFLR